MLLASQYVAIEIETVAFGAWERKELSQRSFFEGSMDTSHSPAFLPVCDRLKAVFEPATKPMPVDLDRLLEQLDDAYARGDLFAQVQPLRGR